MDDVVARLDVIEKRQNHIDDKLLGSGMNELMDFAREWRRFRDDVDLESIADSVKELQMIIHGSDRLGVPPLRSQVKELYQAYDRAKWAAGALGVTNVGIIITWLATIVSRSFP
jgi:hypothetical protein